MKACRMFILIWGIFVISPSRLILMKDNEIYLEFNEQTFSIESNNVTYTLNNRIVSLDFGADIQEALKIEKHIDIDIASHIDINSFGKTLANIFSNGGKP